MMPDWHGTTGRDDLVGGSGETQFSTTIGDVTLCSVAPFTDEEVAALREYFRLLAEKREAKSTPPSICGHCPHAPHNGLCGKGINGDGRTFCACYGKPSGA